MTGYSNPIAEICADAFDESLNIQWPHLEIVTINRNHKDINGLCFELADKF